MEFIFFHFLFYLNRSLADIGLQNVDKSALRYKSQSDLSFIRPCFFWTIYPLYQRIFIVLKKNNPLLSINPSRINKFIWCLLIHIIIEPIGIKSICMTSPA